MKPETTEDVLDLLEAHALAAALGAAMQLGLFWLLKEQPLRDSDIAGVFGIPANRCRYWLQVLSNSGLLEEVASGYAPSPTARRAILDAYSKGSWALLAEEAEQRSPAFLRLAQHIRDYERFVILSKTVILATGGIGRLHIQGFPTTNHYGATADGLVIANRVGAKIIFMDAIQFHPTGTAFPEQLLGLLVSEALRGWDARGNSRSARLAGPGSAAPR